MWYPQVVLGMCRFSGPIDSECCIRGSVISFEVVLVEVMSARVTLSERIVNSGRWCRKLHEACTRPSDRTSGPIRYSHLPGRIPIWLGIGRCVQVETNNAGRIPAIGDRDLSKRLPDKLLREYPRLHLL